MEERDANGAVIELITANTDLTIHLEDFAEGHPDVIAFGCVVSGKVRGVVSLASSSAGFTYSSAAKARMQYWAALFARLPAGLRESFQTELAAELTKIASRESAPASDGPFPHLDPSDAS
jgi:hypothetical protein